MDPQQQRRPPIPQYDECLDLSLRRFVYSSLAGAFGGLLLFRSPVTRWASVAFGAGIGLGSAYTECNQKFNTSSVTLKATEEKVTENLASQDAQD
uniref:MICOS complex subunit Mic10 n=1 Tax=Kalanchoe fedtschenkoi TaxID=63787 RepID=A0A7N0UDW9_KALFE